MSEYNIPVLVKWFKKRPKDWASNGEMDNYMGTVVMCRPTRSWGASYQGPRGKNTGCGWYWDAPDVIPNPTPSQIEEEARKAGKAHVTTQPLVDPMTVEWQRSDFAVGMEVMIKQSDKEHAERRGIDWTKPQVIARDDGSPGNHGPFWMKGREQGCFDPKHLVPLHKIREYEAAQSAQKVPMEPKQVKPPKPTICEVALRAARERVDGLVLLKDTQDRIKNAKASLAKDIKDRRAVIARLEADAAALSKKWLKGAGKDK